jgi:hypothetical protein
MEKSLSTNNENRCVCAVCMHAYKMGRCHASHCVHRFYHTRCFVCASCRTPLSEYVDSKDKVHGRVYVRTCHCTLRVRIAQTRVYCTKCAVSDTSSSAGVRQSESVSTAAAVGASGGDDAQVCVWVRACMCVR